MIYSPTVEFALCCDCYQRRNIVEGETRNSAIPMDNFPQVKAYERDFVPTDRQEGPWEIGPKIW